MTDGISNIKPDYMKQCMEEMRKDIHDDLRDENL